MLSRIVSGAGGNASVAAANMMVALFVLKYETSAIYGAFSFLVVLQAFSNAISNSLFSTALLFSDSEISNELEDEVISLNNIYSLVVSLVVFFISYNLIGLELAIFFFGYSLVQGYRLFWRNFMFNKLQNIAVVYSDIVYGLGLILSCAYWYFSEEWRLEHCLVLMVLWQVFSLTFLWWRCSDEIRIFPRVASQYRHYRTMFGERTRHSVAGVLTTEMSSNGHTYFIMLALGPVFYAPIAAAILLFRPLNIVFISLAQIERPRLKRSLEGVGTPWVKHVKNLVSYSLAFYIMNVVFLVLLLNLFPSYYPAESIDAEVFLWAIMVFSAVNFLRVFRAPLWMLLQVRDQFKFMSQLTLMAAIFYWIGMFFVNYSMTILIVSITPLVELSILVLAFYKIRILGGTK